MGWNLFKPDDELEQLAKILEEFFSAENTAPGRDPSFAEPVPEIGPGQDLTARTQLPIAPGVAPSPFQRPGAENLDLTRLLKMTQGNQGRPLPEMPEPGIAPPEQKAPDTREELIQQFLLGRKKKSML